EESNRQFGFLQLRIRGGATGPEVGISASTGRIARHRQRAEAFGKLIGRPLNDDAMMRQVLACRDPRKLARDSVEASMHFQTFSFGSIRSDGVTYEHDVVIDRGDVRKRKKKPSKKFRDEFGHTPVSIEEKIPWKCRRLVIGTGTGAMPVMDDVKSEAKRRKIALLVLPTTDA